MKYEVGSASSRECVGAVFLALSMAEGNRDCSVDCLVSCARLCCAAANAEARSPAAPSTGGASIFAPPSYADSGADRRCEFLAQVRAFTHRGNALASDDFIEKRLGKVLRPLPVGRPKKE